MSYMYRPPGLAVAAREDVADRLEEPVQVTGGQAELTCGKVDGARDSLGRATADSGRQAHQDIGSHRLVRHSRDGLAR